VLAGHNYDGALDAVASFDILAEINPRAPGEEHPDIPGLWVYEAPDVARVPRFALSYTIDDGTGTVVIEDIHILD
jgi:hypothetical protein